MKTHELNCNILITISYTLTDSSTFQSIIIVETMGVHLQTQRFTFKIIGLGLTK